MRSRILLSGITLCAASITACSNPETQAISDFEQFYLDNSNARSSDEFVQGFVLGTLLTCDFIDEIPDISPFDKHVTVLNSDDYTNGVMDAIVALDKSDPEIIEVVCTDLGISSGFIKFY